MDLVSHHHHVHCISGIGFAALWGVAHDAELQAAARPAVVRQLVVALVARNRLDYLAGRGFSAGRHKVKDGVGIIGPQVELRQIAVAVNTESAMRTAVGSNPFGARVLKV